MRPPQVDLEKSKNEQAELAGFLAQGGGGDYDTEAGGVLSTSVAYVEAASALARLGSRAAKRGRQTRPRIGAGATVTACTRLHPNGDGNGRMARCLQTLILARDRILAPVFSSIEEFLGRNTEAYYDVLAGVGAGSWHPQRDARPWVRFCLRAHYLQARTSLRRREEISDLTASRDLKAMVDHELLEAVGERRARYYLGAKSLTDLRA